jgi:hypothetical protein
MPHSTSGRRYSRIARLTYLPPVLAPMNNYRAHGKLSARETGPRLLREFQVGFGCTGTSCSGSPGQHTSSAHRARAGIRHPLTQPDGVAILTQKLFKATLAMTLRWHNLPEPHTTVKQAALLGMLAFLIVAFADLNFGSSDDSGLEIQFADLVSRTTETSRSHEGVLSLRPTAWLRLRPVVDPRQVLSSARQSDIPSILRI